MVVFIESLKKPTGSEVEKAKEDFGDYIKVVVDLVSGYYTIGGYLQADGEKILLEKGSRQGDLWGGGIDLLSGQVDCVAMINLRKDNASQEILNEHSRRDFLRLIKDYF